VIAPLVLTLKKDDLLTRIARESARLNCTPKQLCIAVLTTVLTSDLVDGVLDGDDPRSFVRSRAPNGRRQAQLLEWLTSEIAKAGTGSVLFSYSHIAQALDWDISHVGHVAKMLHDQGFIVRSRGSESYQEPTTWSLVEEAVAC